MASAIKKLPTLKLVDGLKARPELNGTAVEVRAYDESSGRHVVLTANDESLKLKPSNLIDFADVPPLLLSNARDRGNGAYTARRFHEAVEWYTVAAKADSQDARPLSNRAAAHLEAGDYSSCVQDVDASLRLFPDSTSKLWCRRGKAQAYAGDVDAALASFRQAKELDATSLQLQDALQRKPTVREISPTELSSCRPAPCGALEFYPISNEDPLSALGGRIVQGEEQSDFVPLSNCHSPVRVFIGGVGDGRHGLRTLLDVYVAHASQVVPSPSPLCSKSSPSFPSPLCSVTLCRVSRCRHRRLPRDAPRVEVILNDVKAEALARDLLLLAMLHELGEALPSDATLEPSEPHAAAAALQAYFVYLGVFLPHPQHAPRPAESRHSVHLAEDGTAPANFAWLET